MAASWGAYRQPLLIRIKRQPITIGDGRHGFGAGNDQADHMAWPRQPRSHLLVYRGRSGTAGSGVSSAHRSSCSGDLLMTGMTFTALLHRFFTARLCTQLAASRHTIAGYRDTFRLLFRFVADRSVKPPRGLGPA